MILSNRFKKTLAAVLMIFFWASVYVSIRVGLRGYTPGAMALFRYLIASTCMLIIYLRATNFSYRLTLKDFIHIAVTGILGFSIYNIALNHGEITVSAGITSFVITQIPVILTLLAGIFLKEKLTFLVGIGTVVSFIGIVLIAIGENADFHFDFGVIYILIAAFAGSFYALLQKVLLKKLHPIQFTAIAIWCGTLALCIYFPDLLKEIKHAPTIATLVVIYSGIFPAAVAYLLWSYILSTMPATQAASFLYLIPLVATILGWILLDEIPTWLAATGGLVALSGAIIVNRGVQRNDRIDR